MPLKRAMTKSKRMWGVFDHNGECHAAFPARQTAIQWIESDAMSREVSRPVTVTWRTPKPSAKRAIAEDGPTRETSEEGFGPSRRKPSPARKRKGK